MAAGPSSQPLDLTVDDDDIVYMQEVRRQQVCSICIDDIQHRVSLECGHAFCAPCLGQYLTNTDPVALLHSVTRRPLCPVCKTRQQHPAFVTPAVMQALVAGGHMRQEVMTRIASGAMDAIARHECVNCQIKFSVELTVNDPTTIGAYKVTCAGCGTEQCARCRKRWASHGARTCTEVLLEALLPEDRRAMQALGAKVCPGPCGALLTKSRSVRGCNVLRCAACSIYVCARCGKRLDSTEYDPRDILHARANMHFMQREVDGAPNDCFGRMYD